MGDNIIIRTVPTVNISDYTIGSTFGPSDYQKPLRAHVELPINKGKAFLTSVNTVDRYQSDLDLVELFADDASMQLKIAMDKDLLANIYTQVDAANQGATAGAISGNLNLGTVASPLSVTSATVLETILRHGQAMDEQNISDEGRWLILPSWMIKKIKQSPLGQAYLTGDKESILRNGRVGTVDRFTIYQSNLLSTNTAAGGSTNIISGHSAGLAWASQITEMEELQNPWDFGTLQRGLCVYGYKVIEPKYLFWGVVAEGAG